MNTKDEEQIAREKEAVQKMVGAKSAMETAIMRISRLEAAIGNMVMLIDDVSGAFGEKAMFSTFHHGEGGGGHRAVSVKEHLSRIAKIGRDVK